MRDSVKLATGLIATLSALVVSLLYSYAKGTFNQVNGFNIPDLAQGVLTALPQTVKHRKRRCVIEIWSDAFRSNSLTAGSNLRPISLQAATSELLIASSISCALLLIWRCSIIVYTTTAMDICGRHELPRLSARLNETLDPLIDRTK